MPGWVLTRGLPTSVMAPATRPWTRVPPMTSPASTTDCCPGTLDPCQTDTPWSQATTQCMPGLATLSRSLDQYQGKNGKELGVTFAVC